MQLVEHPLTKLEFDALAGELGPYFKVTVDIENRRLVAGPILHADGEQMLLEKGAKNDDIWGGGVDVKTLKIDATAVLNIRPRLNNDGMEILDSSRRDKFFNVVTYLLFSLWR